MWSKAKAVFGRNMCVHVLINAGNGAGGDGVGSGVQVMPPLPEEAELSPAAPSPAISSGGLRLSRSFSRSNKKKCVICFGSMKPGHGQALFTAECSHTFHFSCIASNVKHGNFVCPVCRAEWKQIPTQNPTSTEQPLGRSRVNPVNFSQEIGPRSIFRRDSSNRHLHPEPSTFDDDEPLDVPVDVPSDATINAPQVLPNTIDVKTYAEFSAVGESDSVENFGVLIHLKAPHVSIGELLGQNDNVGGAVSRNSRAPIDLVTVLDVSGSMTGTKLALLKRAMGFVIQNLGPCDRLSVVSFSSVARRIFPLRRMTDSGRQQALLAVNALSADGGTNIAEGLKKGAKVIEERSEKNPVCSIILLSDGQDTYTVPSYGLSSPNYRLLVPPSILEARTNRIPVHAFGFGTDHDAAAMHAISQISGGTFSFIENENVVQDAFAQCIGGLLSVIVQNLQISFECGHHDVQLASIHSGSYTNEVTDHGRKGLIVVGDLYADEERSFLVTVKVPPAGQDTKLLIVSCQYKDPISNETVTVGNKEVWVQRPSSVLSRSVSVEVDRERNRIEAADAMTQARAAAERGAFSDAVAILESSRGKIEESLAGCSGDQLCLSLEEDLREMQERMASRQRYETSGRAYVLSGLSSHLSQRAVTRNSANLQSAYQTQSMTEMLQRSQLLYPSGPNTPIRPSRGD